MEEYRPGEVVLLSLAAPSGQDTKRRPALVLLRVGDSRIMVARITSQVPRDNSDVEVSAWREAGLLLPSVVHVNQLATLNVNMVERGLGRLSASDWQRVCDKVRWLWSNLFCVNCGRVHSEDALFCWACRKTLPGIGYLLKEHPNHEICEIHVIDSSDYLRNKAYFVARAAGYGDYNAAWSEEWEDDPEGNERKAALDSLIKQLTESGWEPLGTSGAGEHNVRFRRAVIKAPAS